MCVIGDSRDAAGRIRNRAWAIQRVERPLGDAAQRVRDVYGVSVGVVCDRRGLADAADVRLEPAQHVEGAGMLALRGSRGVENGGLRPVAQRVERVVDALLKEVGNGDQPVGSVVTIGERCAVGRVVVVRLPARS